MTDNEEKTPRAAVTVLPRDRNEETRDENGMTSDDIFDQLEDESRVVTSGRGSILPRTESSDGSAVTGYSAGAGSGSGSDD